MVGFIVSCWSVCAYLWLKSQRSLFSLYLIDIVLGIVVGIVELHDGKLWVESEGEGRGSTFIAELPVFPKVLVKGENTFCVCDPNVLFSRIRCCIT